MRHLDLARFSSGSADGDRSRQSTAVEDALRKSMNTRHDDDRDMSEEAWDGDDSDGGGRRSGEEPDPSRAERQRRQRQHESSAGGDGGHGSSHKRSGKL